MYFVDRKEKQLVEDTPLLGPFGYIVVILGCFNRFCLLQTRYPFTWKDVVPMTLAKSLKKTNVRVNLTIVHELNIIIHSSNINTLNVVILIGKCS